MSFREKIAWLTLVTMVVAYGAYFGIFGPAIGFGRYNPVAIVATFGVVVAAQAVVMIVGSSALAIMARREAGARPDERDRAVERRATSIAYYVLIVGMILVGVVMPFSRPSWEIINAALATIVVAEIVHHGIVLLSYRRGWHG